MTDPFPDAADSPEVARARLFSEIYFGRVWSRVLPDSAISIFTALFPGPATGAEIHERSRGDDGLDGPVWEDLKAYTDEELRGLRKESRSQASEQEGETETADDANAEEEARRERQVAELNAYGQSHGLGNIESLGQLLDLMTACGVLTLNQDGKYDLNPGAPLPGEVLSLTPEEVALQDTMRWADLHQEVAQDIIRMFRPDAGERLLSLTTSVQRLARQLRSDPERVREGIQVLLAEGDFTTSIDVTTAQEHQVFTLGVDWVAFDGNRFGLSAEQPPVAKN